MFGFDSAFVVSLRTSRLSSASSPFSWNRRKPSMPGFKYQAYNVEGKLHKGVLEADSARQARAALREQGLTPYRVEVIAANDPAGGSRLRPVSLSNA